MGVSGWRLSARRKLDRAIVRQLATCRWVREHHNVLISGPTGAGKSYVACALAQQACRQGFRALYRRATRLRDELILAHADGTYARLLARFERIDVLVIDDWGTGMTQEQEPNDLLEIIDDRHGARSTIEKGVQQESKTPIFQPPPATGSADQGA
jgi:DNA replication protein DnaC